MASDDGVLRHRYPGAVLRTSSNYAWRLLVLAGALYVVVRVFSQLTEVVIPFIVALLLAGLLQPLAGTLNRKARVPRGLATAITVILAIVIVAGIIALV